MSDLPLGTHVCGFYSTHEELTGTLIPYFTAGINKDEFCIWITADPSGVEGAKRTLGQAAPHLNRYLDMGQIEIWDFRAWYLESGHFDGDRVFGQWRDKEKWCIDSGYKALRAMGDMSWLQGRNWPKFMEYEAEANKALPQLRMTGLCTYCLNDRSADAMLDVLRTHQFAVAANGESLQRIDTSSFKIVQDRQETNSPRSQRLEQLLGDLLEQQDEERRWIASQLHEVTAQNLSAATMYLASLQRDPSGTEFMAAKSHSLCEQSLDQVLVLSHLLHPLILDELGLVACLRQYIDDFIKRSRIEVEFEFGSDIGRMPTETETHLFRVVQEGLSNILRHSESIRAIVRLNRHDDDLILQIEDFGRGMPSATAAATASGGRKPGLGILRMQERVRKIGGRLEVLSSDQGTLLTITIPLL
jgi:signal transduction histidine kinase